MSSPTAGGIVFEQVSKTFTGRAAETAALRGVDLTVTPGSIFGVIGYSGAGKSTLIRLVNGLEKPTTGRVLVDGVDVGALSGRTLREAQKRTGMIFQQFNLLDTVSVRDNVALPLRLDGVNATRARTRANEVLDFVGLGEKGDKHAGELSGGQKQRVGIARALVRNPRILLSDEATSALDPTTTTQIIDLLRSVNREYGTTILVVTHELDVIKDLAHDVAVMAAGEVVEQGTVLETFLHPQAQITRDFVSTVIPQGVPERVVAHLGGEGLWRLRLVDDEVTQPLISDLITDIGVSVNVLHADMTEIQEHTVGHMIMKVGGPPERVAAAREFLAARVVQLEEVVA
ncbi:D-methionine transport system ATP-binding protein [Microbacterium endophyticum]|uniref:D-methionine transport system ATP-binding protein n=1 Tax=Microbacterium endophyticum TaxID=1526412 RepID=A0A7W4YLB9_9MICO|nr:ATP-binding cassette domain-containing protein [Microbacterium endophyticum]MBB2975280.1 D-methionine transport system ATP-binding protein [Microbacterium endophyticum]NIK35701.1 D-methionine transport system ATP-binding protein [Microbacterium endophyticum]